MAGNDGGPAESLSLNVTSSGVVRYRSVNSREVALRFGSDDVDLRGLLIGDRAEFRSPTHHVVVDNVGRSLDPRATAQLFSPGKAFDLRLTPRRKFHTDASIVHYDPRYIANAFSIDNSLTRLARQRMALVGDTLRRVREDGGVLPAEMRWQALAGRSQGAAAAQLIRFGDLLGGLPQQDDVELIIID